jgi:DNA mismatch repair protein MutL
MGYVLEHFGQNTFIIQGIPAHLTQGQEKMIIENIVERYKNFSNELKISKQEILLRSLSAQQAIKPGTFLSEFEMKSLVQDLFNCGQPNFTPSGRPVFIEFTKDQLEKMFGRG